jgi:hypothetical protein
VPGRLNAKENAGRLALLAYTDRMAEADDSRPAGATRTGSDDELLKLAKRAIGDEFELTPAQAGRLRGATASELRDDARAMRRELRLPDLDERERDEHGRYRAKGVDMNAAIRAAAGR